MVFRQNSVRVGGINVLAYSSRKAAIYAFDFELRRALKGATEAAMDAGPDRTQCGNSAVSRIYAREHGH
jgi:hypothetical protein